jgi:hypothetical protein
MKIVAIAIAALFFCVSCQTGGPVAAAAARAMCEKIAEAFTDTAIEIAVVVTNDDDKTAQVIFDVLEENEDLRDDWREIGCELIFQQQ